MGYSNQTYLYKKIFFELYHCTNMLKKSPNVFL